MSESKHTPGPWRVVEAGHPRALGVSPGTLVYAPDRDWNVALCEWGGIFPREVEEARANAALIASAPDLAAEVERLRGALEECVESLARLDDKDGAYRVTVLQQARAVLAALAPKGGGA